MDKKGKLWVLGGKMAVQDRVIFPCAYGETNFWQPTKSNFAFIIKKMFRMVGAIAIKVKDLTYSEKLMLIKFDICPDDDDPMEMQVMLSVDEANGCYKVKKVDTDPGLFVFEDQLWCLK